MKINKTKKEILNKIEELSTDSDNFVIDNYGSEGADNGYFEITYSESLSKRTLLLFTEWLINEKLR